MKKQADRSNSTLIPQERQPNIDLYNIMAQEDFKQYTMENQRKKSIKKQNQKSWAEYLHRQMEEKKRREKLDYDLGINYDNLMVRKD